MYQRFILWLSFYLVVAWTSPYYCGSSNYSYNDIYTLNNLFSVFSVNDSNVVPIIYSGQIYYGRIFQYADVFTWDWIKATVTSDSNELMVINFPSCFQLGNAGSLSFWQEKVVNQMETYLDSDNDYLAIITFDREKNIKFEINLDYIPYDNQISMCSDISGRVCQQCNSYPFCYYCQTYCRNYYFDPYCQNSYNQLCINGKYTEISYIISFDVFFGIFIEFFIYISIFIVIKNHGRNCVAYKKKKRNI